MLTVDIDQLILVAKQRMKLWDIPEEQVKEIETKNEAGRTFILHSPIRRLRYREIGRAGQACRTRREAL